MVQSDSLNVKNRLAILYAISLIGKHAPRNKIKSLFVEGIGINENDWQLMFEDIKETDLIRIVKEEDEESLLITDNGMVVLSFFQDKISEEIQRKIEDELAKDNVQKEHYEWEQWYETRTQMLHLLLLEDNKKILSLQLDMDETSYQELYPIELPESRAFNEDILNLIRKISIKKEL